MTDAALNMCVQVAVWTCVFILLGGVAGRRIAGHVVALSLIVCGAVSRKGLPVFHSSDRRTVSPCLAETGFVILATSVGAVTSHCDFFFRSAAD